MELTRTEQLFLKNFKGETAKDLKWYQSFLHWVLPEDRYTYLVEGLTGERLSVSVWDMRQPFINNKNGPDQIASIVFGFFFTKYRETTGYPMPVRLINDIWKAAYAVQVDVLAGLPGGDE